MGTHIAMATFAFIASLLAVYWREKVLMYVHQVERDQEREMVMSGYQVERDREREKDYSYITVISTAVLPELYTDHVTLIV